MTNPLRKDIVGMSMPHDMLWRVTAPNFVAGFTEYNGEITGAAPIIRWLTRGTASWAKQQCIQRGWKVEFVEDRLA